MMIDTLISLPPSYLVALQFLNLENSNLFFPLSRDSSRQGLINNKGINPLIAYGLRHIKASIVPFFFYRSFRQYAVGSLNWRPTQHKLK